MQSRWFRIISQFFNTLEKRLELWNHALSVAAEPNRLPASQAKPSQAKPSQAKPCSDQRTSIWFVPTFATFLLCVCDKGQQPVSGDTAGPDLSRSRHQDNHLFSQWDRLSERSVLRAAVGRAPHHRPMIGNAMNYRPFQQLSSFPTLADRVRSGYNQSEAGYMDLLGAVIGCVGVSRRFEVYTLATFF